MESQSMISTQILQINHKNIPSLHAIPSLDSRYDNQEKQIYVQYWKNLLTKYEKFRSGNTIKIYSENYLPEILKKYLYVYKENCDENNEAETDLHHFIQDYYNNFCKDNLCKDLVSKHLQKKIQKEEVPIELGGFFMEEELIEKVKVFEEKKENNNEENITGPNKDESLLSKKEFEFLEKFYFLLGLEKKEFSQRTRSEKISILNSKYQEYISKLSQKYQEKYHPYNLKHEREQLTFLSCEQYLNSEEDQYMYNELQELKFFLNALKKANIQDLSIPQDEMIEKSKNLLKSEQMSFDYDVPMDKFISFNVGNVESKKIYQVFDKDFIDKKDNSNETIKNLTDFYTSDPQLEKIYNFEFFSETFEIDDECLINLFKLLCYSVPDIKTLTSGINSGFTGMKSNMRTTFLLIKILCFNYKNFIKITQLIDFYLDEGNYKNYETNGLIVKNPCYSNGKEFENNEKFITFMVNVISGLSLTLIRNNYATNYFLVINPNIKKMQLLNETRFGLKNFENCKISNESIIRKIFSKSVKNKDFENLKNLINACFSKNLNFDQIPKAKMLEFKEAKNPLTFYPYFFFKDCPDVPDSKTLNELLFKENDFLIKSKINLREYFFKLVTKNSANFIPSLCSNILPEVLKNFNQCMEDLNKTLTANKEKLQENMKLRSIEFSDIRDAVINNSDKFDSLFASFKKHTRKFCLFSHNIFKLAKVSMSNMAHYLKNAYVNGERTEQELKEKLAKFQEFEDDLIESMRFFFLKNSNFVFGFLQIMKVFMTVEEIIKLYPQISKSQMFETYIRVSPCLKNFFRLISFVELKEIDQKNNFNNDFLINDLKLPEMKRIETKASSRHSHDFDSLTLEKAFSRCEHQSFDFDEAFALIYGVQDSLQKIFSNQSLSIYRIFFKKTELQKINVYLKMEYIK